MEAGAVVYGLGELHRADWQRAHDERCKVGDVVRHYENHDKYIFRAKAQVHGLRASLYGHRIAEDELIAALKLENANHPLASREAIEAVLDIECARALFNPDVIKRTYPDGKLPEGAVIPPDLSPQAVA